MNNRTEFEKPPAAALASMDDEWAGSADEIELIGRRKRHFGGSMLFYRNPVHIVRGDGVWLFDVKGRKYLDCYNNVASVGHCHPRVVDALCQQARQLNTHTRYLHQGVVDYAERLSGLFPGDLDVCLFVCTGTEANELAMRIARTVTGKRGAIVMHNSYHGNSTLINELSTCAYPADQRPDYVEAVEPPNTYRGAFGPEDEPGRRYAELVDRAIEALDKNGSGVAAFLCDSIFDTQGTLEAPTDYFQRAYSSVRAAGGLCIADEVQSGFARTGQHMWGFENYDVVPDIVTLGKPMGAGHPIGAVVTTPDIAAAFAKRAVYFNTFGGNPVSAAVGSAVLDVFEEEGLQQNVREVGSHLRGKLLQLAHKHRLVGDVRGRGLFLGIELVRDPETREPAMAEALAIAESMRETGVLLGVTGRFGNVIKIRPPLVFCHEDADFLVQALDSALGQCRAQVEGASAAARQE